ncbi:MgtC/SapB family protein [Microbacterium murale]|uniref:MgtC/SapB family protein n=1 Tax=Microbacterium murale TaxID=1081040 RepID=UPI00166EB467|nr:MgtC/SapB family protein [Microbacterium murale]
MSVLIELYSETTLTEIALLAIAFVLSAIIGVERQRKLKSAGLRTHTLVGLGSAVFTLVSAYGFSNVVGAEVILDPSRIAAQIVSGIGFLGAGVIFVRRGAVSGLTTAASIWVTAAIGMACGAGMPVIAVAATVLHLLTVGVLTFVGRLISPEVPDPVLTIRYRRGNNVLRQVLEMSARQGYHSALEEASSDEDSKLRELTLRFTGDLSEFPALVGQLSEIDGVESVVSNGDDDD